MEKSQLKSLIESLIFVSEHPLKVQEMHEAIAALEDQASRQEGTAEVSEDDETFSDTAEETVFQAKRSAEDQLKSFAAKEEERISHSDIVQALEELVSEYQDHPNRGIILSEVANGWQFRTRPENAVAIRQLYQIKPTKLSKPSLETLAIVAYRQPVTRVEIDEIRGVDSGGVLKTLLEKNLLRIVGKKEEPGRPMLYGTTQEFLELFQLKNLRDLPTLKEFRELEEEFRAKEGAEGVVVQNTAEEGTETSSILELSSTNFLEAMDEEEEEIIEDLEGSLKELRHVEQEIFPKEEKEEEKSSEADIQHP